MHYLLIEIVLVERMHIHKIIQVLYNIGYRETEQDKDTENDAKLYLLDSVLFCWNFYTFLCGLMDGHLGLYTCCF